MAINNSLNNSSRGFTITTTVPDSVQFSTAGILTNPNQPCFKAIISGPLFNITGNGAIFPIVFDVSLYDNTGGAYNYSTGVFTCNSSGFYIVSYGIVLTNVDATNINGQLSLDGSLSHEQPLTLFYNPFAAGSAAVQASSMNNSVILNLLSSDQISFSILVTGGVSNNVGIMDGNQGDCYFSAIKIC